MYNLSTIHIQHSKKHIVKVTFKTYTFFPNYIDSIVHFYKVPENTTHFVKYLTFF